MYIIYMGKNSYFVKHYSFPVYFQCSYVNLVELAFQDKEGIELNRITANFMMSNEAGAK